MVNILSDMKDTFKQFIDSRLQEATRAQAIYPDQVYVASGLIRRLNSERLNECSESSSCDSALKDIGTSRCHHKNISVKKDFMW
jgi:hypothetical protein